MDEFYEMDSMVDDTNVDIQTTDVSALSLCEC